MANSASLIRALGADCVRSISLFLSLDDLSADVADLDGAGDLLRLLALQVYRQQPVLQRSLAHLQPVGQHESALELPRGDAAMKVGAPFLLGATTADHELVVLDRDLEVVAVEPGHRKGDTEPFAVAVGACHLLYVVGRITVAR